MQHTDINISLEPYRQTLSELTSRRNKEMKEVMRFTEYESENTTNTTNGKMMKKFKSEEWNQIEKYLKETMLHNTTYDYGGLLKNKNTNSTITTSSKLNSMHDKNRHHQQLSYFATGNEVFVFPDRMTREGVTREIVNRRLRYLAEQPKKLWPRGRPMNHKSDILDRNINKQVAPLSSILQQRIERCKQSKDYQKEVRKRHQQQLESRERNLIQKLSDKVMKCCKDDLQQKRSRCESWLKTIQSINSMATVRIIIQYNRALVGIREREEKTVRNARKRLMDPVTERRRVMSRELITKLTRKVKPVLGLFRNVKQLNDSINIVKASFNNRGLCKYRIRLFVRHVISLQRFARRLRRTNKARLALFIVQFNSLEAAVLKADSSPGGGGGGGVLSPGILHSVKRKVLESEITELLTVYKLALGMWKQCGDVARRNLQEVEHSLRARFLLGSSNSCDVNNSHPAIPHLVRILPSTIMQDIILKAARVQNEVESNWEVDPHISKHNIIKERQQCITNIYYSEKKKEQLFLEKVDVGLRKYGSSL